MNILFVCTGNTCRSPMAEAIMKTKWPEDQVRSAGVFAGEGESMAMNSELVLREKNLTLHHETSPVTIDLLEWANLILAMTDRHKETLAIQFPEYQDKLFTLKEYVLIDDEQWSELKALYTDFEEKRSMILKEHSDHLSEEELRRILMDKLAEDMKKIEAIENQISDVNITDPYGGSLDIYRSTRDELEAYIDLLVKKLKAERT